MNNPTYTYKMSADERAEVLHGLKQAYHAMRELADTYPATTQVGCVLRDRACRTLELTARLAEQLPTAYGERN